MRIAVALAFAAATWGSAARAESATSYDIEREPQEHVRVGAMGGVGFPRPLSFEALVRIERLFAFGAEYGALPQITIDKVDIRMWSLSGDARFFPMKGALFIGVRAGTQHITGSRTVTLPQFGASNQSLSLDGWFINPRLGMLWVTRGGVAIGIEAGIQIPVNPVVSSTLPLDVVPGVKTAAGTIANSILPTLDLFRVGLLL
jgi:hypothetical protein